MPNKRKGGKMYHKVGGKWKRKRNKKRKKY